MSATGGEGQPGIGSGSKSYRRTAKLSPRVAVGLWSAVALVALVGAWFLIARGGGLAIGGGVLAAFVLINWVQALLRLFTETADGSRAPGARRAEVVLWGISVVGGTAAGLWAWQGDVAWLQYAALTWVGFTLRRLLVALRLFPGEEPDPEA